MSTHLVGRDLLASLRDWLYVPNYTVESRDALIRLGSDYGGWRFIEDKRFYGGTIISCGLGEDASFDVEFAAKYNATVIVVDPTVRAIKHFQAIMTRVGVCRDTMYAEGGNQPINAYDMSKLDSHNLRLVPKAIWTHNKTVEFFAPSNPSYVSHSIVDFQNNYSKKGPSYEVECITIDKLLEAHGLDANPLLLKLDIEGAQGAVIRDMISKRIYPAQILVEFDELQSPSLRGKRIFQDIDGLLRRCGYRLCNVSNSTDFTYTREV